MPRCPKENPTNTATERRGYTKQISEFKDQTFGHIPLKLVLSPPPRSGHQRTPQREHVSSTALRNDEISRPQAVFNTVSHSKEEMKFALILLCLSVIVGCQSSKRSEAARTAVQVESLVDMLFNGNERAKADAWEKLDRLCGSNEPAMSTLVKEMNKPKYISKEKGLDKLGDSKWKKRMLLAGLIDSITTEDFHTNTSVHGWNPDYSFDLINQWWLKTNTDEIEPVGSDQPM